MDWKSTAATHLIHPEGIRFKALPEEFRGFLSLSMQCFEIGRDSFILYPARFTVYNNRTIYESLTAEREQVRKIHNTNFRHLGILV
jgi:hypothetical protein